MQKTHEEKGGQLPCPKGWGLQLSKNLDAIGRLTATLALMFLAATAFAGPEKPQQVHANSSLLGRLDRDIQWQIGHS
jgi:hypothetical protein